MNHSPRSLALLAVLLLAGSVLAEPFPRANPSGAASDRENRRCTSSTLSADASAPCSDDAVNDRQRVLPAVVRPPAKRMTRSRNPSPATSPHPGAKQAGKASTGGPEKHRQAR